jgi:hypothetical protein
MESGAPALAQQSSATTHADGGILTSHDRERLIVVLPELPPVTTDAPAIPKLVPENPADPATPDAPLDGGAAEAPELPDSPPLVEPPLPARHPEAKGPKASDKASPI